MPARPHAVPLASQQLLNELGVRLRQARLRRRLSAASVAAQADISRVTLHRAERGEPALSVGTLVKVMGALDLAHDIALLARDDPAGRQLQDEQLRPSRTARPAATRQAAGVGRIEIKRYPQLRQIAWQLGPEIKSLRPEDAFALYERNWRHVDHQRMNAAEQALLQQLTATVGKGVLLV
jgi:transcriptional regulator with XRE-family HTH domain